MIYYLIISLPIAGLFIALLDRIFPEKFMFILTEISFNALYLYSNLEIYFTRVNRNINDFIESNHTLLKIKNKLNYFKTYKNEEENDIEYFKNGILNLDESKEFDLSILSWSNKDNNTINKKIIYDVNEKKTKSECSDIKFILIELQIGDNKTHKIDLKTNNYNFYIVGNKFTKSFFVYYLKQILKIDNPIDEDEKIAVKIIDHNVDTFKLEFTDKNEIITLSKNDYIISNENHG